MSSSAPATRPSVAAAPSGRLSAELCLQIYDAMLRARVLEERLITMYKQGEGFFWIGGPGGGGFNVPPRLLVDKGPGGDPDFLHFHYRPSGAPPPVGADPGDPLRPMEDVATGPPPRG